MALIEIRDVPDDVHEAIRRRAQASGRSIEAYLLSRIIEMARRPTPSEVVAELPPDDDGGSAQAWTTGTS